MNDLRQLGAKAMSGNRGAGRMVGLLSSTAGARGGRNGPERGQPHERGDRVGPRDAPTRRNRFVGLEITTTWATRDFTAYNVVDLDAGGVVATNPSQLPNNIVFDRCYIHGTPTGNVLRGIAMNGASVAVIDSYLADFHHDGSDSQALAGWAGPGPFKVVNNYLEGAGENLMFGGSDPGIANLAPSDIEIRRNYPFKPLSWQEGHPTYAGIHWGVKNILELKNAQSVLIEGNVLENNWVDAQNGFAVLFTVRNQDGTAPWSIVQDVTFRLNVVRHVASGVNVHGSDNLQPSQEANRILIQNNLLDVLGSGGRIIFVGNGETEPSGFGVLNLVIEHNTLRLPDDGGYALGFGDNVQPGSQSQCYYRNNVTQRGQYGVFGSGAGEGTAGSQPILCLALCVHE